MSAMFRISLMLLTGLLASSAQAADWDLCARGVGLGGGGGGVGADLKPPFSQTLRVKLTLEGAALDPSLVKPFASQLIRATVWAGRADQVTVELYDAQECSASLGNELALSAQVSQADVEQAERELSRGAVDFTGVAEIARRALQRLDLSNTAEEQRKHWLRIYYATNRQRATGTAIDTATAPATATAFSSVRSDELSWGAIEVAVLHQDTMRDLRSPALVKIERATSLNDFEVAATLTPLTLDAWRAELQRRAARFEQPGALLFIHGFNVSFASAAQRSAQLAYDLAFPGPTVFFSWPSDASVVRYFADGRDARNSRQAAATVMGELASLLPSGPVYVVAHSMGNRVLVEGLSQLFEDQPGKRRALREVVMAAPDVDQEDFRLNYASRLLRPGTPRFTLYASKNDLALSSSEALQGGKRLGYGGDALYLQRDLDSVDASAVTKEFFSLNHSYFGDTTTVLSDLFHLIRTRLPPTKRPSLKKWDRPDGTAWAF